MLITSCIACFTRIYFSDSRMICNASVTGAANLCDQSRGWIPSFGQQHAVEMRLKGCTGEPARFLQVVPKHCVAQRGACGPPPPSVGWNLYQSIYFPLIQVAPLTSLRLRRQSQDALLVVFLGNQLILCHSDICDYNLAPFKPLGMC